MVVCTQSLAARLLKLQPLRPAFHHRQSELCREWMVRVAVLVSTRVAPALASHFSYWFCSRGTCRLTKSLDATPSNTSRWFTFLAGNDMGRGQTAPAAALGCNMTVPAYRMKCVSCSSRQPDLRPSFRSFSSLFVCFLDFLVTTPCWLWREMAPESLRSDDNFRCLRVCFVW